VPQERPDAATHDMFKRLDAHRSTRCSARSAAGRSPARHLGAPEQPKTQGQPRQHG
jgi:hypothetical protein